MNPPKRQPKDYHSGVADHPTAGLGMRCLSTSIDFSVVALLAVQIGMAHVLVHGMNHLFMAGPVQPIPDYTCFLWIVAGAIVFYVFSWSLFRDSLGRTLLGLEVRDSKTAKRLPLLRLVSREMVGKTASGIFLAGYSIALFRRDQRALHDLIFRSKVVKARSQAPLSHVLKDFLVLGTVVELLCGIGLVLRWRNAFFVGAVAYDFSTAAKTMLILSADPQAAIISHETPTPPILLAVFNENIEIVRSILDHGGNPNSKGVGGRTPLMLAAETGQAAVVQLLLKWGARKDLKDDKGLSARDYALAKEHVDLALLL